MNTSELRKLLSPYVGKVVSVSDLKTLLKKGGVSLTQEVNERGDSLNDFFSNRGMEWTDPRGPGFRLNRSGSGYKFRLNS